MGQLPKTNTEIEDLRKAKTCICQCEANFFDINGDLKILTDPKKRRKISSNQASWAFVTCQCVCENKTKASAFSGKKLGAIKGFSDISLHQQHPPASHCKQPKNIKNIY